MKIKFDELLQIEYLRKGDGSRQFVTFRRSEKLQDIDLETFEKRYGHVEAQHIVKVPIGEIIEEGGR